MCQNKFEYFLLEMHDKINNKFVLLTIILNWRLHCSSRPQQLFVDPLAIQWPPFDAVTNYRPLGWTNWPL